MAAAASIGQAELDRMAEAAGASIARHGLEDGAARFENAVSGTLSAWASTPDPAAAEPAHTTPTTQA
jgi:hypothetical protein